MTTVLIFKDGSWEYDTEYFGAGELNTDYISINIGSGFNDREVSEMVCSLLEENSLELFC